MGAHDAGVINVVPLNEQALREWPLPAVSDDGDKEDRGRVLVIAGSREMPGAAVLAGTNALRAGAGKLTVATDVRVARHVALAVPEARVVGLRFDGHGMAASPAALGPDAGNRFDAVVIGPGMPDDDDCQSVVRALFADLAGTAVVLDAAAMRAVVGSDRARIASAAREPLFPSPARVLLTPHAGEMAKLTGLTKDAVVADPAAVAARAARRWNAVVALKGSVTYVATPAGRLWCHQGGNVGLASSGSGDVLAGIIAGLAARGAALEQAAAWGVALHAHAGDRLAKRIGTLGFLAREIGAEIPGLLDAWSSRQR